MGPLAKFKIIEMKGIGPGPFAGRMLADMGAEVIVVERSTKFSGIAPPAKGNVNSRNKKSIALNLKTASGVETLLQLVEDADAIFEGYRPGVAERLGIGPDVCLERNPGLVYGRITGWGQTGPLAQAAGHDINYIALTGALAAIGGKEKPVPPLNLVGDYAAGSLYLVTGILAALLEAKASGKGQVVDAAITDGAANLMASFHGMHESGRWNEQRANNWLDGAAHYYDVYETADNKFVSIGSIEPQFYAKLLELIALDNSDEYISAQNDPERWAEFKVTLADVFKTRTRDQWCELLEGTDVCFAPVLNYCEAPAHPHNIARETYLENDGYIQPAPAPRFSRTPCASPTEAHSEGSDTETVLLQHGFSTEQLALLKQQGVLS